MITYKTFNEAKAIGTLKVGDIIETNGTLFSINTINDNTSEIAYYSNTQGTLIIGNSIYVNKVKKSSIKYL